MIKKNSTPLNRIAQAFSVLLIASAFCSCEKNEMPVPAHDAGNVVTSSVKMEVNYRYQVFFDLENNTIVQQNVKTDWDLGFESTVAGNRVILNSAKLMFAAVTNQTDFLLVTDTVGLRFKWDVPSGNLDSKTSKDLHKLFFDLRKEFNQTFIIVTHNQELADMSDRKLIMEDGRIVS